MFKLIEKSVLRNLPTNMYSYASASGYPFVYRMEYHYFFFAVLTFFNFFKP